MNDMREINTNSAEAYKRFKPTYSKELYDFLYSQGGFTKDSVIADIGSGTGIFCRPLLERGSKIFAVEPGEEMRGIAEADFSGYHGFVSICATAEDTNLAEQSVDFITSAEGFHLFDIEKFKKECSRILKPGGKVVLVWNTHAPFVWGGGATSSPWSTTKFSGNTI
ncbi:MAG: class I SAM-dependent methyltransferase [Clostridiales bacterium]|nr:class I SAM-dependent methyltransferase [Clostridiales bacterium]